MVLFWIYDVDGRKIGLQGEPPSTTAFHPLRKFKLRYYRPLQLIDRRGAS
jgi:hypothetical protein